MRPLSSIPLAQDLRQHEWQAFESLDQCWPFVESRETVWPEGAAAEHCCPRMEV